MKQTARELLLARHSGVTLQLDSIRLAAIADATPITASQFLPALFRPNRRLWLGLAVAWIVILTLNFIQRPSFRADISGATSVANWSANQAQLHALLAQTGPERSSSAD